MKRLVLAIALSTSLAGCTLPTDDGQIHVGPSQCVVRSGVAVLPCDAPVVTR